MVDQKIALVGVGVASYTEDKEKTMTREEFDALAATWPECEAWTTEEFDCENVDSEITDALERTFDERDIGYTGQIGMTREESIEDDIRQEWPDGITLFGITRKVVSEEDIANMVDSIREHFDEYWTETLELGNPEEAEEDILPDLESIVRKDMEKRFVWGWEQNGTKIELTVDQLVGIQKLFKIGLDT